MQGKIVFSLRSWPYLVDDRQKRHELRSSIRGLCGGIGGLIASIVVNWAFDKPKDVGQILMYAVIYGLLFEAVSMVGMGLACLLGKAGCNVFCKEEKEQG